ncbi:MAG: hypothetical protein N3A54_03945 [Patescibacteria group bacterium]|nr:hypothetical protein [Patescibacteria group bacterium]
MKYGTKLNKLGKKNDKFLVMEYGRKYTIRILPSKDGENTFFEAWVHYKFGEPFLCPKRHFRKECPLCDLAQKIYNDPSKTDEERNRFSALFPKKRVYMNIFVRSFEDCSNSERVKILGVSKTLGSTIYGYMLSDEYGDVTDTVSGVDFTVSTTKKAGLMFPVVELMPKRKQTPLADTDEEIEEIMESLHNLREAVPVIDKQEILDRIKTYYTDEFGREKKEEKQEAQEESNSNAPVESSNDNESDLPF